jgi:hypothetical protein
MKIVAKIFVFMGVLPPVLLLFAAGWALGSSVWRAAGGRLAGGCQNFPVLCGPLRGVKPARNVGRGAGAG